MDTVTRRPYKTETKTKTVELEIPYADGSAEPMQVSIIFTQYAAATDPGSRSITLHIDGIETPRASWPAWATPIVEDHLPAW